MSAGRWIGHLSDRDANEERRYLVDGQRACLTWSWLWLNWGLGVNVNYEPYGDERGSALVLLGPLCIEVYFPRKSGVGAR